MVSVIGVVGLLVLVAAHTLIAAVLTRFFRLRLDHDWAAILYTVLFVPVVLAGSTIVLSGGLGLGLNLGDRTVAITVAIVLPLALGYVIDTIWMPDPEEVELPDKNRPAR